MASAANVSSIVCIRLSAVSQALSASIGSWRCCCTYSHSSSSSGGKYGTRAAARRVRSAVGSTGPEDAAAPQTLPDEPRDDAM